MGHLDLTGSTLGAELQSVAEVVIMQYDFT